jgi:hypothetical protein
VANAASSDQLLAVATPVRERTQVLQRQLLRIGDFIWSIADDVLELIKPTCSG